MDSPGAARVRSVYGFRKPSTFVSRRETSLVVTAVVVCTAGWVLTKIGIGFGAAHMMDF